MLAAAGQGNKKCDNRGAEAWMDVLLLFSTKWVYHSLELQEKNVLVISFFKRRDFAPVIPVIKPSSLSVTKLSAVAMACNRNVLAVLEPRARYSTLCQIWKKNSKLAQAKHMCSVYKKIIIIKTKALNLVLYLTSFTFFYAERTCACLKNMAFDVQSLWWPMCRSKESESHTPFFSTYKHFIFVLSLWELIKSLGTWMLRLFESKDHWGSCTSDGHFTLMTLKLIKLLAIVWAMKCYSPRCIPWAGPACSRRTAVNCTISAWVCFRRAPFVWF